MGRLEHDRHRMVMDTFVELADTLASDYDVSEFLAHLVDRCGVILKADTAGVMLENAGGTLQLAAAMSEEMGRIEQIEIDHGEGPCVQAYRTSVQIIAEDLADAEEKWPTAVPELLAMGMRAGYAFPLRLRETCIGALNIYRRTPGLFPDDDILLAQAFADVAAIGILQERRVARAEEHTAHLQHALQSRIVIEQAKGMLAQQHGVTPQRAFDGMRAYARTNRVPLRGLAEAVVAGGTHDIPLDD